MKIIGITGIIASGKSLCASMITRSTGGIVIDADKIVHTLYSNDLSIIRKIQEIIGTQKSPAVDRKMLLEAIVEDPLIIKKVEMIVHPVVKLKVESRIKWCRRNRVNLAVLDVPLLFRSGLNRMCSDIIVLSPGKISHKHMSKNRYSCHRTLSALRSVRAPDPKQSHHITMIRSGMHKLEMWRQLQKIL